MTVSAVTIRDEISGKPVVLKNPLREEHIKVDTLFWYNGHTSMHSWNCPAVITEVNRTKKQFRVRSLDDMREHCQWYDFKVSPASPPIRKRMRVAGAEEVKAYLESRIKNLTLNVAGAKTRLSDAEDELANFKKVRANLKL